MDVKSDEQVKSLQHVSEWIPLYRIAVTTKPVKEQFLSIYTKYLQLTKLNSTYYSRLFVDIRGFNNDNIPSKFGVTLYLSEFRWIISRLFKNKAGVRQEGKRTLTVTKGDKFSMKINLKSSFKKSELWLNYGEIKCLKETYQTVNSVIKGEAYKFKSELSEDFNVDEIEYEIKPQEFNTDIKNEIKSE